MFRSFTVGALCALSTTFITAVTAQGAGFQPNDIVVVRGAKWQPWVCRGRGTR